jgi:hypothetical protein
MGHLLKVALLCTTVMLQGCVAEEMMSSMKNYAGTGSELSSTATSEPKKHRPSETVGKPIGVTLSQPGTMPPEDIAKERRIAEQCVSEVNAVRTPHGLAPLFIDDPEPSDKNIANSLGKLGKIGIALVSPGAMAAMGFEEELKKSRNKVRKRELDQAQQQYQKCVSKYAHSASKKLYGAY